MTSSPGGHNNTDDSNERPKRHDEESQPDDTEQKETPSQDQTNPGQDVLATDGENPGRQASSEYAKLPCGVQVPSETRSLLPQMNHQSNSTRSQSTFTVARGHSSTDLMTQSPNAGNTGITQQDRHTAPGQAAVGQAPSTGITQQDRHTAPGQAAVGQAPSAGITQQDRHTAPGQAVVSQAPSTHLGPNSLHVQNNSNTSWHQALDSALRNLPTYISTHSVDNDPTAPLSILSSNQTNYPMPFADHFSSIFTTAPSNAPASEEVSPQLSHQGHVMPPGSMNVTPGMMDMTAVMMNMPPGMMKLPQPTSQGMDMPLGLSQKDMKSESKLPVQTHTDNIPTKNVPAHNKPTQNPLALVRKQPENKVNLNKYYCDECKKGLTSKEGYNIHKNLHKGISNYKCEFCGKGYTTRVYFMEHRSTPNVDYLKCKKCGAKFRSYQDYCEHRETCK